MYFEKLLLFDIKLVAEYVDEHLPVEERGKNINIGGVDGVEANIDDPGQHEGGPSQPQQVVAESPVFPQLSSDAVLVHQSQALGGVQTEQGGHSQTRQEEEEQAEVDSLPHQGGLVQEILRFILQQSLVVVVVVGENAGERVHDQPWRWMLYIITFISLY